MFLNLKGLMASMIEIILSTNLFDIKEVFFKNIFEATFLKHLIKSKLR